MPSLKKVALEEKNCVQNYNLAFIPCKTLPHLPHVRCLLFIIFEHPLHNFLQDRQGMRLSSLNVCTGISVKEKQEEMNRWILFLSV